MSVGDERNGGWWRAWGQAGVRVEQSLSAVMLAVVLAVIAIQVVARYVFASPLTWSEEVARFAFIWLVFLSSAFVMAEQRHIAVDVVTRLVGRAGRVAFEVLAASVVVACCGLLVWEGAQFAWRMRPITSPATDISRMWWYAPAVVGLTLVALHALLAAAATVRRGDAAWHLPPEVEPQPPGEERST